MADDIAIYLSLDEAVLARCQIHQPKSCDFSDPARWVAQVRIVVGNIIHAPPIETPRFLLLRVVATLIFILAGIAWYWASTSRFIESTDDAYVGGEITTISAKVAGVIQMVAVADNQPVKVGDLLLKLEDRDYRAQFARAQASVAAQRAALTNVDANRRMHQAVIEQASATVAGTAAELARTKYDLDRYRTLSADQFATRQRFEQADADYEKARAADRRARAALDATERQLDVIDTQRQQTQAALDQAVAEGDLSRLNLSYTEIRAPIDGIVGNRGARSGAYAGIGAQLLAIVPARGL
jgi:membrane fusion protein, multidrug efflux system